MFTQRIRVTYVISLVILAAVAAFFIFQPLGKSGEYRQVVEEQLLETSGEWIVQINITNIETRTQNYTIDVLNNDEVYTEDVTIGSERSFAFIRHIPRNTLTDKEVKILIYKEGSEDPIEELTYHLK